MVHSTLRDFPRNPTSLEVPTLIFPVFLPIIFVWITSQIHQQFTSTIAKKKSYQDYPRESIETSSRNLLRVLSINFYKMSSTNNFCSFFKNFMKPLRIHPIFFRFQIDNSYYIYSVHSYSKLWQDFSRYISRMLLQKILEDIIDEFD